MESTLERYIEVTSGGKPADLVIKQAKIINVFTKGVVEKDAAIYKGIIVGIGEYEGKSVHNVEGQYPVSEFIDGHVHIESSLLSPSRFSKVSLPHGVTIVVTDPHEIENIAGSTGLQFMIEDARQTLMNILFMPPSCVPVTPLETNSANLSTRNLAPFLQNPEVLGLAEVMNYQTVADNEADILERIRLIHQHRKKIGGRAAGIGMEELGVYPVAGIRTDHEATTTKETKERLDLGMYLMVQEKTVAKDLASLLPAITLGNSRRCFFVTDDKLINDLVKGGSADHIVRQATSMGIDPLQTIQIATLNTAECFGLKTLSAIAPGYRADFFLTDDLTKLPIHEVFCRGILVVQSGQLEDRLFADYSDPYICYLSNLDAQPLHLRSLELLLPSSQARVIGTIPSSLVMNDLVEKVDRQDERFIPSIKKDQLKIAVIERHHQTGNIGLDVVEGFQLKQGAIAATVAHDSHNLIIMGASDEDMLYAANLLIQESDGMTAVNKQKEMTCLPLPIGGIMAQEPFLLVNEQLSGLIAETHRLGAVKTFDPFLTLSFLTLSVISRLKITSKGLFSFSRF